MLRIHYRLALCAICSALGYAGPAYFLAESAQTGYMIGGLVAAAVAWLLLSGTDALSSNVSSGVHWVVGGGAALLSWGTISLVAFFDVLPHALQSGLQRFDPVWLLTGAAPLALLTLAAWRARQRERPWLEEVGVALFRFSLPLFGLHLLSQAVRMTREYIWLFLFTGVLFLTLEALIVDLLTSGNGRMDQKSR